MDDPDKAVLAARRAVDNDPRLAAGWSVLGYALARQDKADEAERALRRALDLDPTLPQPYASLGTLAAKRGDYGEAAASFARSLELDPDQPQVKRIRRMAEVCAAVPVASSGVDAPTPGLERLLVAAAVAGFPECVHQWLGSRAWPDGGERETVEAYLRAQVAVRSSDGNNPR